MKGYSSTFNIKIDSELIQKYDKWYKAVKSCKKRQRFIYEGHDFI